MTPEGEALLSGQEPLLGMKDLYVEHILINGIPYELYEDFDKNGNKYYYLMLTYGEDKFGGFLADRFGNLIDFEGNILTSIEDMSEILQDYDAGELLDTEDDLLRGILIKKIVGAEQIGAPDEELELGMDACCLKSSCLPKLEFCSCK